MTTATTAVRNASAAYAQLINLILIIIRVTVTVLPSPALNQRTQRKYKYTRQVCIFFSTTTAAITMVLKLYGSYRSPWVRLAATVLKEKKVPFDLVPVDTTKKEQKLPEYLEKQPFGQIPCIVCDLLYFCSPAKY